MREAAPIDSLTAGRREDPASQQAAPHAWPNACGEYFFRRRCHACWRAHQEYFRL